MPEQVKGNISVGLGIRKMCNGCNTPKPQPGGRMITGMWRCNGCVSALNLLKTPQKAS